MTTHAAEITHADHSHDVDPRVQLAASLKFEPSELRDFDMADKAAGQMMGKLLAFLFCVLLFLMAGVNIWMISHASTIEDKDPLVFGRAEATAVHH